jgi:hypothetical protein
MKLTKKAAALLLAASLAVSVCATPVFAADPNMGSNPVNSNNAIAGITTGDTQIRYKVTESYMWSVPATIDFGVNAGENNTSTVNATLDKDKPGTKADNDGTGKWKGTAPRIVVSKNVIGVGKKLQITVDTEGHTATSYENGKFYVEPAGTNERLYFTITKPAATGGTEQELTGTDNEVLRVPSGTNTANQELVFTLTTTSETAEKAGDYEGYVAFSSKIVD